jgi:hypothetical protein
VREEIPVEGEEGFAMDSDRAFEDEEMKHENGPSFFGRVLNFMIFTNPISKYIIAPTLGAIGYVIPNAVKNIPSYFY